MVGLLQRLNLPLPFQRMREIYLKSVRVRVKTMLGLKEICILPPTFSWTEKWFWGMLVKGWMGDCPEVRGSGKVRFHN